jgi:predicted SAM-dependent methyltransferase
MNNKPQNFKSECAKLRPYLEKYCQGCGLDLGSGGDKITPSAISVDLVDPYADVGSYPVQLKGDARYLIWFKSNTLDYVHSSHLLEDFPNTIEIMIEWSRVLKQGGYLVLNLPHEIKYREHCKKTGQPYNQHHTILEMSADYIKKCAEQIPNLKFIYNTKVLYDYSFGIVFEKV